MSKGSRFRTSSKLRAVTRLALGGATLGALIFGSLFVAGREADRHVAGSLAQLPTDGLSVTPPQGRNAGRPIFPAAAAPLRSVASLSRWSSTGSADTTATRHARASASQTYLPTTRSLTVETPINVMEVAREEARHPRPAPPAITEIEAPVSIPRGSRGVPIKAVPAAPPPSVTGPSPGPTKTFPGEFLSGTTIPPDTMGAVGDTHIVTVSNNMMRFQDRNGVQITRMTMSAFWSSITLEGGASVSAFDTKVYYDRFNDRFFMTSSANAQTLSSAVLFAFSATADPTGVWYRYSLDADPAATAAGGRWIDYPTVGFNKDWVVVMENEFNYGTSGTGYYGPAIFVLDKATAYTGPGALTVPYFQGDFTATCLTSATPETELACGFTMAPAITEDNTTTTEYLVEDWDSTAAQLRLSKLTGPVGAPVLTVGTQFPQSPNSWRFDARRIGTTGGYEPQKDHFSYAVGTLARIQANDSRIQNAVLRNGSLWTVHHVMLSSSPVAAGGQIGGGGAFPADNHTAIQWWKIDPTIETGLAQVPVDRGRIEDSSADNCHNGTGGLVATPPCSSSAANQHGTFFAFPNISVNAGNDVLIGFTQFSAMTYPSAAYAMRLAADPAGTMRDPVVFHPGEGNYNIGAGSGASRQNRWGDYSAAQTDPLNDTDFWTIQEYSGIYRDFGIGVAGPWETWWALVKPSTAPPSTSGSLIISEFRLRGPQGVRDEFVELYNPAGTPTIVNTADNSDGWALAFSSDGTAIAALGVIPNGTVIPARGHLLFADDPDGSGAPGLPTAVYSLSGYTGNSPVRGADSDIGWTPDLADTGGLAIFKTANTANFAGGTLMDSAGPATIAAGFFKEGTGFGALPTSNLQYAMFRKLVTGTPADTGDNAGDFQFADTSGTLVGAFQRLGAPGPENLDSPHGTTGLMFSRLDSSANTQDAPNRVFDPTPVTNGTAGTLALRRFITNNTGSPITRLRFRIVDLTTFPAAGSDTDLRALNSSDVVIGPDTVRGTTVEVPPAQANGGGLNSSLSTSVVTNAPSGFRTITPSTPLPNGASLPVQFLFGENNGNTIERVTICAEALPAGAGCFRWDSTSPTAVTIATISAVRGQHGVVVRWRTGAESRLVGFEVYRQVGVKRVRVTSRLIPARKTVAGGRYSFVDRSAPQGRAFRYWIRAVQLNGRASWNGPAIVK